MCSKKPALQQQASIEDEAQYTFGERGKREESERKKKQASKRYVVINYRDSVEVAGQLVTWKGS